MTMQHGGCADVVLGLAGALSQRLLAIISHLYCWLGGAPSVRGPPGGIAFVSIACLVALCRHVQHHNIVRLTACWTACTRGVNDVGQHHYSMLLHSMMRPRCSGTTALLVP